MTIKLLVSGILIGGVRQNAGSFHTLSGSDEATLVGRGVAEYAEDWQAAAGTPNPIGSNELLNVQGVITPNRPFYWAAVSSGANIVQGAPGLVGDWIDYVEVANADGSNTALVEIRDGTTQLVMARTIPVSTVGYRIDVRAHSVIGAWNIEVTKGGTIGQVTGTTMGLLS